MDDFGWCDLGCYGGLVKMFILDGLVVEGMWFIDFYFGVVVCFFLCVVLFMGWMNLCLGIYSWINDND